MAPGCQRNIRASNKWSGAKQPEFHAVSDRVALVARHDVAAQRIAGRRSDKPNAGRFAGAPHHLAVVSACRAIRQAAQESECARNKVGLFALEPGATWRLAAHAAVQCRIVVCQHDPAGLETTHPLFLPPLVLWCCRLHERVPRKLEAQDQGVTGPVFTNYKPIGAVAAHFRTICSTGKVKAHQNRRMRNQRATSIRLTKAAAT